MDASLLVTWNARREGFGWWESGFCVFGLKPGLVEWREIDVSL
jgi:hypothetical protein